MSQCRHADRQFKTLPYFPPLNSTTYNGFSGHQPTDSHKNSISSRFFQNSPLKSTFCALSRKSSKNPPNPPPCRKPASPATAQENSAQTNAAPSINKVIRLRFKHLPALIKTIRKIMPANLPITDLVFIRHNFR